MAFITKGKKGFTYELEQWEESAEIHSNPKHMDIIRKVQKRIAQVR